MDHSPVQYVRQQLAQREDHAAVEGRRRRRRIRNNISVFLKGSCLEESEKGLPWFTFQARQAVPDVGRCDLGAHEKGEDYDGTAVADGKAEVMSMMVMTISVTTRGDSRSGGTSSGGDGKFRSVISVWTCCSCIPAGQPVAVMQPGTEGAAVDEGDLGRHCGGKRRRGV